MSSDCVFSEQELVLAAQKGRRQALDHLVQMHQGMICLLASRLCQERVTQEELIQAGNLGLMYAVRHYEPQQQTKLMTYAVPWILGEMRRAMKHTECGVYSMDRTVDDQEQTLHDVLAGESGMNIQHIDLRLALSRLNQEEQVLLTLRYFRDKSQKESAVILKKSQAQVSRIERHALDALHAMLS